MKSALRFQIWMVGVCAVFASAASAADLATSKFVEDKVSINGCTYGKETIRLALEEGLGRVALVNRPLVDSIKRDAFRKPLNIFCDVGPSPEAIFYSAERDSIHLRRVNVPESLPKANFFHEFLHFYGLDHIDDPRIVEEMDVMLFDPVFACHLAGFPELAERLKLTPNYRMGAAKMCATVKPVNQDLRGTKY